MAVAAMALSACASASQAGSAVVWDSGRITEDQFAETVSLITAIDNVEASPQFTNEVLNFVTQEVLVAEAADRLGVSVTPGAVERGVAGVIEGSGGEAEIAAILAASGSDVEFTDYAELVASLIRRDLLIEQVALKLAPESAEFELPDEVLAYLSETSVEINLTTNPRFGVWDPVNLAAQPNPDQLSRPGDNEEAVLPEGLILPEGN
jgi:hypothetical protein